MFFRRFTDWFVNRCRSIATHIRQHSLLVPTLVSFMCFTGAVLLIISIWFTSNVSSTLEDTLYENATQASVKSADQMRLALSDFTYIAARLSFLDELSPRAYLNDFYEAYQAVSDYNFTTFKFSDLIVCYKDNPLLLSVRGTCYRDVCFPEVSDLDGLMETIDGARSIQLTSTAYFGADGSAARVLLIYPLSTRHTAVFVLNHTMLTSMVSPASSSNGRNLQVLYDLDGTVLWSSEPLSDEMKQTLFASAHGTASDKEIQLDGTEYIYVHEMIGYGATLVLVDEVTTQFDSLNAMMAMLIAVCVAIMLLGILMLYFSIRRGYLPIAHLVRDIRSMLPQEEGGRDIDTLQTVYSQYSALLQESQKNATLFSSDQLRSLFVLRTISGRYSDPDELNNLCQWLNVDFQHPWYFACILLFDQPPTEQERRFIEEKFYYHHGLDATFCFYLQPGGQSAVGIANVAFDALDMQRAFGEALLGALPEGLEATLGMGQIYDSIASLGKSYLEAHASIDYRLIKGRNTCITYDEVHLPGTSSAYPHQLMAAYIHTLRGWDVQGIRQKLQQLADYIRENNLSLQQVKCICFDLTSSFLREISSLDTHVTYKLSASYDVFNIAEYASVSELVQKICDFSENIQQYIYKRDEHEASELIRNCIAYLENNISNVQFSLSSCSEQFDIAPQTLRRKFKEATGQTLSNYITTLRINRAKELLTGTEMDVNTICQECGYLDQSSFIRLFKAEVGVSPGRFREMQKAE